MHADTIQAMCKANSIQQHNGINVTPEATLRFKEGGLLKFKDRYVMQHLALDLGYPFYLHDGHIYSAEVESVKIADEASVFQMAMPMCKAATNQANNAVKRIPIAVVA